MLIFAGITVLLALWLSLGRGAWADSALWFALAAFFGSYGALLGGAPERWHRPLLVLGLGAGLIAFVLALRLVGLRLW